MCKASLERIDSKTTGALYRLVATASDPFWTKDCSDMARVNREVEKAEQSTRDDLRLAARRVREGLAIGDKRMVFLALRDIDPPCSYLFNYGAP